MQDCFFTVIIPLSTDDPGNITAIIDDGVQALSFTCNASTTPAALTENVIYFRTSATADRFRVRIEIDNETVTTLVPTVLRGLHGNLEYLDQR